LSSRSVADFSSTPPDSRKEVLKRRVAERLIARNPQLQLYQFPYEKIAQFEKISLEETRRKYRHLELSGPEGGNGIQVTLWDDEALLTLPFWHELEKAEGAFLELWNYADIVCRETGYAVYDPQMERKLDPSAGYEEALANYLRTAREVRDALPANGAQRDGAQTDRTDTAGSGPFPMIRQVAAGENSATLLALNETGTVCGYAEVSVRQRGAGCGSNPAVAYLESWYVVPEFRGRGFGLDLLEAAEQWAAARGLRELASEVELNAKDMIRAHLACGFAESRRAVRFTKPIQLRLSARRPEHSASQPAPACEPDFGQDAHTEMASTLPEPDAATARL
jgi:aminoglycoside 6'-N-acetyltransferase I